jgi:hypothetical protein
MYKKASATRPNPKTTNDFKLGPACAKRGLEIKSYTFILFPSAKTTDYHNNKHDDPKF